MSQKRENNRNNKQVDNNNNNNNNNDSHKKKKIQFIRREERNTTIKNNRESFNQNRSNNNNNNNNNGKTQPVISIEDQIELERLKDQSEKKELESRMRKAELEKNMKKLKNKEDIWMEDKNEELKRKSILYQQDQLLRNEEDSQLMLEEARQASRFKYLKERLSKQIELKKREILENRTLFAQDELTEMEKKLMELDELIYQKAKETAETREDDTKSGFFIAGEDLRPEKEKRVEILQKRYESDETERTDQQFWEEQRLQQAYQKQDGWEEKAEKEKEKYEPLLQDQIEFIIDSLEKGKDLENELKEALAAEENNAQMAIERKQQTIAEQRKDLPIYKDKEKIIEALQQFQILIIVAETGSGKTTQIPQYIYDHKDIFLPNNKKMAITQPRRVAAMSVAKRVSEEMGCHLGGTVGYNVRFEDRTSEETILTYLTDGMLLQQLLNEPGLTSYSVIMIDEAHERTLHTDILFGLVKDISRFRNDIKLIISSATLQAYKFSEFFDSAPIYSVRGRMHPVETYYLKTPESDYLEAAVLAVLQFHLTQPPGDILVFLTGQEEIDTAQQMIEMKMRGAGTRIKELLVLPIYANLPADQQIRIFEPTPPGARKVVLATNIAETSLTIDGIIYVIDTGFAKLNTFDPKSGMDALMVAPISRANAEQRKGRAGRVAPGKCFRLYTKEAYENEMEDSTVPEIQRTNLASVVLLMKSLGINDFVNFDFMDSPCAETVMQAFALLYGLGALNHKGELTKAGRRMAEFPLDPQMSKCIIESEKHKCSAELITICSVLSCNHTLYHRPRDNMVTAETQHKNMIKPGGDLFTILNIYNQWKENEYSKDWCHNNFIHFRALNRSRDIRDQLEHLLTRVEIELESNDDNASIGKCLCSGYFMRVAMLSASGEYKTVKTKQHVLIHPSSTLAIDDKDEENRKKGGHGKSRFVSIKNRPKWVLFTELVLTTQEYMRNVIEIEPKWLLEVAPHYFEKSYIQQHSNTRSHKMPKNNPKSIASAQTLG